MRGSITPVVPRQDFVPFDLTVRIENKADLIALWARFNMSGAVLAPAAQTAATIGKKGPFSSTFYRSLLVDPAGKKDVWKLLDGELKKAGIARR